jgi:excisionase family DNA binding protein
MSANLNAEDAAKYLGGPPITAETVKGLARRKQIGYVKVGRATVFPTAALDAYIEAHTVQPEENPWGLTDAALRTVRNGRTDRRAS